MDAPGVFLGADFVSGPAETTAPQLLNKIIMTVRGGGKRWARIVEVEAYAEDDPASHAFSGRTRRNGAMFGPPGRLYVYFTYGMHWCANVVTGPVGSGQAVLLRAAEPLGGLDAMQADRPGVRERDLCRGPARLARALAISGPDNDTDLVGPPGAGPCVRLLDDGVGPPSDPGRGPRVGISRATESPWRWWVPDSPWVSAFRPGGPRGRRP